MPAKPTYCLHIEFTVTKPKEDVDNDLEPDDYAVLYADDMARTLLFEGFKFSATHVTTGDWAQRI